MDDVQKELLKYFGSKKHRKVIFEAARLSCKDQNMKKIKSEWSDICLKCRGKGYFTELRGYTIAPDFPNDKRYTSPLMVEINYCDCQRGQALKRLVSAKDKKIAELKEKLEKLAKDVNTAYIKGKQEGVDLMDKVLKEGHGGGNFRRILVLGKEKLKKRRDGAVNRP